MHLKPGYIIPLEMGMFFLLPSLGNKKQTPLYSIRFMSGRFTKECILPESRQIQRNVHSHLHNGKPMFARTSKLMKCLNFHALTCRRMATRMHSGLCFLPSQPRIQALRPRIQLLRAAGTRLQQKLSQPLWSLNQALRPASDQARLPPSGA